MREVHVARFHVVEFQKRGLPHAHLLPTGPRWAMWPKELRSFRLQVWGEERQFWAEYDEDDNYKGWLGARKEPPPQWHLALTQAARARYRRGIYTVAAVLPVYAMQNWDIELSTDVIERILREVT